MKSLNISLVFLFASCATDLSHSPWLLPRGKQLHTVKVTKLHRNNPEEISSFTLQSVVDLSETKMKLTALTPVGTTLFKADDSIDGRVSFYNVATNAKLGEAELKKVYERLRPLFWAKRNQYIAGVTIREEDSAHHARTLLWELGDFQIQVEIKPL